MKRAVFTIEDYHKAYIGYSSRKWKGIWDMAHFELAEAQRVAVDFNECAEYPIEYDPIYDQFFMWDEGQDDYLIIKGVDRNTEHGIKHLYEIGVGWLWSAADDRKCFHLAQLIEDFVWEYDTYGYKDEYNIDRDAVVNTIKTQLLNPTTFQRVYEAWNGYLTSEQKFETLRKELQL